jgi:hypothetical protein
MNFLRSSIVKRVSLSPLNSRFELGVGKKVAELMAFHSSGAYKPKQLPTIHRWIPQTQPVSVSDDKYSRALGFLKNKPTYAMECVTRYRALGFSRDATQFEDHRCARAG